jgi:hypothetical protein
LHDFIGNLDFRPRLPDSCEVRYIKTRRSDSEDLNTWERLSKNNEFWGFPKDDMSLGTLLNRSQTLGDALTLNELIRNSMLNDEKHTGVSYDVPVIPTLLESHIDISVFLTVVDLSSPNFTIG